MISDKEKCLIKDFVSGNKSKEKFLLEFDIPVDKLNEFILKNLIESKIKEDAELLAYTIPLFYFDENFKSNDSYVEILNQLLLEKWHWDHENIIGILQGIKSPQSAKPLFEAATSYYDYLSYDNTYSLVKKCIYALYDINSIDSNEYIRKLSNSDKEGISGLAKRKVKY